MAMNGSGFDPSRRIAKRHDLGRFVSKADMSAGHRTPADDAA